MEEGLFTNWSSEGSSPERATQQVQSVRSMEPSEITRQREPTERESENTRDVRHVPESVMTSSSTREQANQVGARVNDREPSTVVEIRLTRDEEIVHAHDQGVQVPTPGGGLSSLSMHTDEFTERTVMPNVMPQLVGPASVHTQRRQPSPMTRRTTIPGDGFPDNSDSNSHDFRSRGHKRNPRRRYYQERGGRPPDREGDKG